MIFSKLKKKIDLYFLGAYANDPLETQKKIQSLLYFALLLIPLVFGFLIYEFIIHLGFTWVLIGDTIFFIALLLSLLNIKNHHPHIATNVFLGIYANIFFTFCLADYFFPEIHTLEEILMTTLVLIVALNVFSLIVLNKRYLIIHGIICNLIIIFHYFYILVMSHATNLGQTELLISSLFLMNLSIFLAWKVYNSYHELLLSKEESQILTKVIRGFIPICAKCKAIRLGKDEEAEWQNIEQFISENSEAVQFTHSLCKKCLKELSSELDG